MLQQLRHLEPFRDLDWSTLQSVARHATLIELPAGRPMQAPGRTLTGRYYLLRGKLRSRGLPGIVTPSPRPIYPGIADAVTLTPTRLLHVNDEPIAFLFAADNPLSDPHSADPDCWQTRFLQSHMLTALSPRHWQEILRSLTARSCAAKEWVLRAGEPAAQCFILASGQARVLRSRQTVRRLSPGDFFGEDALLSGECRNASVQMCTGGVVMALDQQVFQSWLADVLISGAGIEEAGSNQRRRSLQVTSADCLRERLQGLDPCSHYLISGSGRAARLAVFLLRQRGIRATLG